MFRYSMKALLIVVLLAALFSAALTNPSMIWTVVIYGLTLALLSASTLAAIETRRAWPFVWGFAALGWMYLATAHIADRIGPHFSILMTQRLEQFTGMKPVHTAEPFYGFVTIGQCLWTLIFATIGGLTTSWLQRPPNNKPKDQP